MSEISDFSKRFSAALQGVMRENKVTVEAVSKLMGKSKGFVSTHTSGKAAPDTDLIDAIAVLSQVPTRDLIVEVARRMRPEAAPQAPSPAVYAVGDGSIGSGKLGKGGVRHGDVFYVDSSIWVETFGTDHAKINPTNTIFSFLEKVAPDDLLVELVEAEDDLAFTEEDFRQLEAIANGHDGKPIVDLQNALDAWWHDGRGRVVSIEAKTGRRKPRLWEIDENQKESARDEDRETPRID